MATSTAKLVMRFAVTITLATASSMALASDPALNLPGTSSGLGGVSAAAMALSFGQLVETYAAIVGVWYALKSIMIFSYVSAGKAQPNSTMGSAMSHFGAGVLAYHSREFFAMINNTIPMIPDFGKLIYDAELIMSLI